MSVISTLVDIGINVLGKPQLLVFYQLVLIYMISVDTLMRFFMHALYPREISLV